jgi:beta-glucosidase
LADYNVTFELPWVCHVGAVLEACYPGAGRVRRLAGWCRVALKPGQSAHLTVTAGPRLLVDFDSRGQRWQRPAGAFLLQLGHSATSFQGQGKVTLTAASWSADAAPTGVLQACD